MTNQEIIDLAAQFDLITFGPQDLVFFAREIEKRTIERCVEEIETFRIPVGNSAAGEMACEWTYDALHKIRENIRALGDDDA